MTSKYKRNRKNISKTNNIILFTIIAFLAIAVFLGLQKVYAYYQVGTTSKLLASRVGDFDFGEGDVNLMIYRENDNGDFVRVYAVPSAFYVFNDDLTSCTIPCNDGLGNCEYSFDSINRKFSVSSNQNISCKFYFEQTMKSDVSISFYLEDENGTDMFLSKSYMLVNKIPAYGYKYTNNYSCFDECGEPVDATLTYNSETKRFNINTQKKASCHVYFEKFGVEDASVGVYVQESEGSGVYNLVDSIPSNKMYVLNDSKTSCASLDANGTAGTVSYVDGYIEIESDSAQSCAIYLDLASN